MDFLALAKEKMQLVELDPAFGSRSVNEGFSGGEKKRNEVFQMAVLEPRLAILDEIDSGLDIDALRVVARGVNALRRPDRAILLVTHYQRLLDYVAPDHVHVMAGRPIVRSGGPDLARRARADRLRLGRGHAPRASWRRRAPEAAHDAPPRPASSRRASSSCSRPGAASRPGSPSARRAALGGSASAASRPRRTRTGGSRASRRSRRSRFSPARAGGGRRRPTRCCPRRARRTARGSSS